MHETIVNVNVEYKTKIAKRTQKQQKSKQPRRECEVYSNVERDFLVDETISTKANDVEQASKCDNLSASVLLTDCNKLNSPNQSISSGEQYSKLMLC